MTDLNPLLTKQALPAFDAIQLAHIEPALDQVLAEGRALIAQLTADPAPATWDNFIAPLMIANERIQQVWSPVTHLNAVCNSDVLRVVYNICLPKLTDYQTEVTQNPELYKKYQQVAEYTDLDHAARQVLNHALRDFRLAGVTLPPVQQARYKTIIQELSTLTNRFEENLLDATNAWFKHITDEQQLTGLPITAIALAQQQAQQRGLEGWIITLDIPSYLPVMQYADDRALRCELYTAYSTRASDQGPHAGQWDNSALMEQIVALRHESAQLVGFANYAELSLATKMAPDTASVIEFLTDLAARSLPQARREFADICTFAAELGQPEVCAWDVAYYSEKLRLQQYAISQEALRPYFPVTNVIPGLFAVAERLFDVCITPANSVALWHPEVQFYQINDLDGTPRAAFYLDLYARQKKRGGAWMDVCVNRFNSAGQSQLPVAYLVCNFTPPVDGQPSQLTHQEVETLFHEFGHGLHHMLTRVNYPPVAGINGVAWDAVELPSQFLENWCWQRESLDLFAAHIITGALIPDNLYQRLQAARHFQSAMQMVRQLEFALFDFQLHRDYDSIQGAQIAALLAKIRAQVAVYDPPAFNRFAHSFSHIFAGGYAAGYYSYKWAERLAADAFSLFEERGIFDTDTGQRFRQTILEQGGAVDAMELFIAFRGRPPCNDALLRHCGIAG
ncbi:M3 family metallopeptidase [Rhodoferax sp. 4810]|uniref:oligopeptidase A n=1 Tax=Thiospirillum jenense TaxID=1653858 RepID=A0A839HB95_9GAMM|nr:M3 family metallopeptidase [Thiospirillum jenense]MBB1076548.1 M3 family metallopeptidase [Rhodoferax jenense]MBB1124746.1 M3 family metallopeptidase [Thiospirillum jenense]